MNKSTFIQALNSPAQLDASSIESIQALVQEYPYFQSAQLLLTKAFHTSENFNFEQQLRKSAAYAADRKVLHELLFSETEIQEEVTKTETQEDSATEKVTPNEVTAEQESAEVSTSEDIRVETESESHFNEVQSSNEDSIEKEDALEQQILTSAINSSILLEVSDEINLDDLPIHGDQKEIIEISEPSEKPTNTFDESETHSFSSWLSHFKDDEPEKPLWESQEEVDKIKSIVESKEQLPVRQEFYSPSKMAKLSVQDNDDLVTETLANIYADQGNFEKAIKSFQKLQLKYPEKKIYFAGRIKEIENQLNSQ